LHCAIEAAAETPLQVDDTHYGEVVVGAGHEEIRLGLRVLVDTTVSGRMRLAVVTTGVEGGLAGDLGPQHVLFDPDQFHISDLLRAAA